MRIRAVVRRLTVDQWRAIDTAHRDPDAPWWHVPVVLVTVCLAVTLERY